MSVFVIGDTHLSQSVDKPMDIFGGRWENYTQKLCDNWRALVREGDTVVIAGDVSWAMSLADALADFKLIDTLPGKKLILKGNHDYWWETASKMKRFLKENEINSIDFIFNNSFLCEDKWLCGTRGWMLESTSATAHDKKIIARECSRLDRSLASAGDGEKIAFLHYPPIYDGIVAPEFIDVMQKHGVSRCFYGHLHGISIKNATEGTHFGINFTLVSADAIDFLPISI